jgi:hypothetical protein
MAVQPTPRQRRVSEPGVRMSGELVDIPLPDVMQLLSTNRKSGVLLVSTDATDGRIYFRCGQIYSATVVGGGSLAPREAIYRMLGWRAGTFVLQPADEHPVPDEIEDSTVGLLLEGMRRLDEHRRSDAIELEVADLEPVSSPAAHRPRRSMLRRVAWISAVMLLFGAVLVERWLRSAGGHQRPSRDDRAATPPAPPPVVDHATAPVDSAIAPVDSGAAPVDSAAPRPTRRRKLASRAVPAARPAPVALGEDHGFLIANTRPWAKVRIDGVDTGKSTPIAPRWKIPLAAGKHVVSFTAGGQTYHFDVVVRPHEDLFLIRDLEEDAP